MKQVLAELHSLINDLEDQGLIAEASSLQDVFIRVAEEAETDDLANDVKAILESHPVAKVLEEIAKQMGGDSAGAGDEDTQTSSFAYRPDSGAGETSGQDVARVRQNIINYFRSMRTMQSDDFKNDTERANAATEKLKEKLKELKIPFQEEMAITPSEMFGTDFETSSFANEMPDSGTPGIKQTTMNNPIVKKYVDLVARFKMDKEEALTKMNEELKASGQPPIHNIDNAVENHRKWISRVDAGPERLNLTPEDVERMLEHDSNEMKRNYEGINWNTGDVMSQR